MKRSGQTIGSATAVPNTLPTRWPYPDWPCSQIIRSRSSAVGSLGSARRSSSTRPGSTTGSLLEAGDGVGGAWHWNTYPGIGVDIPSFSYQFSFEQRADWSRVYAPGNELKAYAEHCVDTYGLRSRIRLNAEVTGATFDDEHHFWRLEMAEGPAVTARFIVGATGVFTKPKPPEIKGVDELRRHGDAHRALGPRPGSARQAGGDHRHRRLRGPGDPLDRAGSRAADRVAAHADLVPAQARRADPAAHARAAAPRPRRTAGGAAPEPALRRAQLPAARAFPRQCFRSPRRRTRRAQAPALRSAIR